MEMNRFGIGPKFALLSILYGVIILFLHYYFFSHLTFTLVSRWVNIIVGCILIVIGLYVFILSGIMVHRHINREKLCTTGVYSYMRHPLYASWIIFIIPGIVLVIGSIVAISGPLVTYIIFRMFINEEDRYLKEKFGEHYVQYEKEVNAVFPTIYKRG
jgi:protein-S-isoprenylcysteine O-methyltransferase Ste14